MKLFCIPDTSENKKYIEKMLKYFPHRDYEEMKSLIGTYQGEYSKSDEDPVWPTPEELLNWERKMYGKPTDVKILLDPTKQESSTPTQSYSWGRTSNNSLEVSTRGDAFGKQFSALNAKFKEGTVIEGEDVSGKTIEEVYQKVIKKSAKGRPPARNSKLYNPKLKSNQQREDFSYELGYLPLWQEWAKQNPELIELLAQRAAGKVLTDLFANTRVSLARALSDILNARNPTKLVSQEKVLTDKGKELKKKYNSLKEIYKNTDGTYQELAEKVFDLCAELGFDVQWVSPTELGAPKGMEDMWMIGGDFHLESSALRLNKNIEEIAKKGEVPLGQLYLHEAIHAITSYALLNKGNLSKKALDAVTTIEAVYLKLKELYPDPNLVQFDPDFYGLKNLSEMIAELANPNFRKILKKHSLFDRITDAIKEILSELFNVNFVQKGTTLEKNLLDSLDTLINNFDKKAFLENNRSKLGLRWGRDNLEKVHTSKETWEKLGEADINKPITIQTSKALVENLKSEYKEGDIMLLARDGIICFVKINKLSEDGIIITPLDSHKTGLKLADKAGIQISEPIKIYENTGNPISTTQQSNTTTVQSYTGLIKPEPNTIFVFGSNPDGIHGAGAALEAQRQFGAKKGVGEGLLGNSYALPTKDLKVKKDLGRRSISPELIIENIKKLYKTALQHPDKLFKVAYTNVEEVTLNGYSGLEMMDMFLAAGPIPSNMVFSENWIKTGKFNNAKQVLAKQPSQSQTAVSSETLFSTSTSGSYADRTRENAEWADATIHFAIDYNTAGERLTKKAAGEKYVKSPLQLKESGNQSLFAELERYEQVAQLIYEELKKKGKTTNVKLNIAGNGIYTLKGIMTQEELNEYVTNVLKHLQELGVTIAEVRSGGLTGIDEAGIIAAKKLGIPNTVHATKDWKFRDENNKDIRNEQLFKERFNIATETATETVTELPQTATEEKTEPTSSAIRTELSLNIVRFQLAFSNPIERKAIISKVALMFLNMVYTLFEEQLKILENRIANETDKSAKVELIELLENLSATDILKANGVNSLFNQIKGDLQDWLNDYNTNDGRHALLEYEMDGIANIFPNLTAVQQYELAQKWITNKASAYLRIVENWDMMVIKTLPVIKDSIGVALSIQTDSITEITGEEFIEGNEDISISDLNTANELFSKEHWTFKIREVSNFSRLSAKVKRMINDIVEIDADGNVVFDDMGDMRYLNAQVVHRELLLGLAQMNKAKDFMPAMRKLAKRHPYVNQIIDELLEDNSKACAIFKNYRKDTQIYHALITKLQRDGSLKTQTVKLNEQTGVTTLLNSWRMNYEYGNVMSRYSIYDRNGLLKKKQLKENLEIINKLHEKFKTKTDWTKEQWINFSKQEEVLNTVRSLLESVGVSVNEDFFELTITSEALTEMGTNTPVLNVLNHLRFIYDKLGEPKYSTKTPIDFIREFNSMYKYFAEVTGGVLEDCIESHIIRNGKTIYAHNNPSYVTTLIKTLSNSESFREYIELEYGPVEWFKKDGRWMNYIIKDLMDPEKGEQTREKLEHVVLYDREGKEYAQWSAVDTVLVLIELYKSDPTKVVDGEGWAYYPIPVLADAQSAEFIKYKRVVENVEATIIDRLVTVVEQELDRISLVIKRNETEDVTKIAAYDKGGMEFKFFPELNKMTVGGKSFIEALNEKKTEEERESVIKEALTQIMSERYREAMKEFDRMGLFDNVPNKANAFKYFQDFNTKELIQESLKEWFYNSVFAQSQIIELLTTDLAFYPNLTTFYKRAKQFHAPSERLNTMATWKVNGEEQFVLGYEKDENGNYVLDENGDRKINEKERFITLADAKQVSLSIEDIDKGLEGITRLSNDEKAVIKGLFRNVNTTDAQAYRTLDGMRKIMIMADEWSDALEDAYNNIKNNKWHAKDIVALMNVNKPYLYTQVNQSDQVSDNGMIRKPIQNKNSEAVLAVLSILGAILSSPKLDALNFFMERHNIDLVQFESAVKVGNQGVIDINGMEDPHEVLGHLINETQKPYYIQEVDYNDYGIQVRSTQHAVDDLILVGTLARRLMGADANPDGDPNFRFTYTQGKTTQEWTVEQWFNYYNAINTSLIVDAFQGISEKFKTVEDISKFLIDEVRTNPRWGLDLIEAFTLNSEGLFNIPLLDPSLTIRILNLLNSIIRNQVTKQKQDGAILAMVSTYGLLEENEPKIVYETDPKTGKKKVAYVECYVPCPSEELYQMLIKDGSHAVDINKKDHNGNYIVPRKYLEAIGYRIPTEATYSMAPLRIKGFLPKIVGSVIILPREITTLAGSDFDYDKVQVLYHKLNISHYDVEQAKHDYLKINQILRNVNKSKDADATSTSLSQMLEALDTEDGFQEWFEENKEKYKYLNSKTSVVSFKHDDTINKDDKEAVYNYVKSRSKAERHSLNLDLMYSYLTNSDTLENFIDPGNVSPLKKAARIIAVLENLNKELVRSKVAELLEVEESEVVKNLLNLKNLSLEQLEEIFSIIDSDTNPLSPLTWVTMHQRNMAAAEMIGVVAVHRVSHASFLRTKIKSKEVFNINGHKMSALNAILAPDGTYVSKNLAGFVGAIIDNAKDPIAGDMHLTMQTADVAFTLLRLGVSPTTMALMISQPIVQSIVKEMLKNNSSMLEAIQAVETTTRNMKILLGVRIPNKVNITDEHLMGDIVEYNKRLQTNERGDASLWVSLLAFLLEFKKLEKLGLDLKALTLSTRADSASGSAGPTMADNILTEERIQQVMERTKSKYFTIEGAEGLIKSSLFEEELMYSPIAIQQAFYTYGLEKVGDLFKDILPYQSKGTYRYLSKMLGKLSRNGRISEKTLNKLYSDFISFYLSQFPEFTRTYTVERWVNGKKEQVEVSARDYYMLDFPLEFEAFLRKPEVKQYNLFRRMKVLNRNDYNPVATIIMDNVGQKITDTVRETYMDEWTSLLFTEQYSEMMLKLFNYVLYRGFGFTASGFSLYIPAIAKMMNTSYIRALRELTTKDSSEGVLADNGISYDTMDNFLTQFIRNNLNNPELVQTILSSEIDNVVDDNGYTIDEDTETFTIELSDSSKEGIRKFAKPYESIKEVEFRNAIKIRVDGQDLYFLLDSVETDARGFDSVAHYKRTTPLGKSQSYVEYSYDSIGAEMTSLIEDIENMDSTTVLDEVNPEQQSDYSAHNAMMEALIAQSMARDAAQQAAQQATGEKTITKDQSALNTLEDMLSKERDDFSGEEFCR